MLNSRNFGFIRQNSTIYALKIKCFNKGVIGRTTKKGEDYSNKSAVKLQVTLCRINFLNAQLIKFRNNLEPQKYYIYKNSTLSLYIAKMILFYSEVKV
ncbi:hypothetical protein CN402_18750 [Bacillus sp. AFS015896]|nr:hypothetical protein CN402_18750 [Bacillus sp. AFS015896]